MRCRAVTLARQRAGEGIAPTLGTPWRRAPRCCAVVAFLLTASCSLAAKQAAGNLFAVEETCTLHLVEATLAGAMCDQSNCEINDEGKPGPLSAAARAAMAMYLLSVRYPPSPQRPYTNAMTAQAREGIRKFQFEKQCGNCHRMPFWTMTNMGGSGMDVPS